MRLQALIHLTEAVRALSGSQRIRVLGSSALLARFPELGEGGGPLELSFDADLLVEPCDEGMAALLHEAVGEGSLFSQRAGYHADILRPQVSETLPLGWEQRLIPLSGSGEVAALAPEDLVVVKLRAGRPKDLALCRCLIRRGLVNAEDIRARLDGIPMPDDEVRPVYARLKEVMP
jgi:hypothetical protein